MKIFSRVILPGVVLLVTAFGIFYNVYHSSLPVKEVEHRQLRSFEGDDLRYKEPRGVSVTPFDTLLVTDFRNYRVQELSFSGEILREWGKHGNAPGQFNDPACAAMDTQGNLYVVDTWNHRVQKYTTDGQWISHWAKFSKFFAPRGIAIDRHNRVYITNTSAHHLVVFDSAGNHLHTWGSKGDGLDQFHDPIGVAVGSQGDIYVADTGNGRIKVLSPEGKNRAVIPVEKWRTSTFQEAYLATDTAGHIYVTVPLKGLIQVYHPTNSGYVQLKASGSEAHRLTLPTGIAVDRSGNVYVSDTAGNRVIKYGPVQVTFPDALSRRRLSFSPQFLFFSALLLLFALIVSIILAILPVTYRGPKQVGVHRYRFRRRVRYLVEDLLSWRVSFRKNRSLQTVSSGIAVVAILAALFLFRSQIPDPGAMALLFGSLLILLRQLPSPYETSLLQANPFPSRHRLWVNMLIVGIVALCLRLYKLDSIPWGINNDAAWNGMFALRILDGEPFTIFTPEAWGKETMYMYLIALSFKLFGVSKLTLYLPSLLAGVGTTMMVFLLTRKLFHERMGTISALIYAAMAWNITFARTGYRCILAPLCLTMTVYFYLLAVDAKRTREKLLYFIVCGLSIGIGLNTYFSFRSVPLLMILLGLYSLITTPHFLKKNMGGLLVLLLAGVIVFVPLGWYALQHMEVFMGRSNFLFVGHKISQTGSLQPLWNNIYTNLLTFYYKAKVGNFFNNDIPIVSPVLGFFAAIGFGYHVRYILKRGPFFLLLAFAFGLLPAILSAPDAARSFLVTVPLSMLAATGVLYLANLFSRHTLQRLAIGMSVIFCAAIMLTEGYWYYHVLGNDSGAQFGYARKHTLIGEKGAELGEHYRVYISQGHFMDTPKFLCYDLEGDVFGITRGEVLHHVSETELMTNLQNILQTPAPSDKGVAFIFESDPKNAPLFHTVQQRYPHGIRTDYSDDRYGSTPIFYTYVIPKDR
ncbi:MAG: hypothetical protein GY801_47240 [bacterium]|nr:hypothetical protein [bacterium]